MLTCYQAIVAGIIAAEIISAATSQTIWPTCEATCGNIGIPYPFGTTKDCSFDKQFLLTCNKTNSPPKLFFGGLEVINITLDGELHIYTSVATVLL